MIEHNKQFRIQDGYDRVVNALHDEAVTAGARFHLQTVVEDEQFYTHNWHKDPFTAGAYSYVPVGGLEAQSELAKPLENTFFFAGEATNDTGRHATVHGAIATGLRTAKRILKLQESNPS